MYIYTNRGVPGREVTTALNEVAIFAAPHAITTCITKGRATGQLATIIVKQVKIKGRIPSGVK
jgi:hypothetical protein